MVTHQFVSTCAWARKFYLVQRGFGMGKLSHHRDSMSSTGDVGRPSICVRLAKSGTAPPAASSHPSTTSC